VAIFHELKRRNIFRVAAAYLVAAWVLLQACELILGVYETPDYALQIVIALLAVGFPFVLLFSWVFEVTPEGIKRESQVDRTKSITGVTAKRLDIATISMVIMAMSIFALDKLWIDERSTTNSDYSSEAGKGLVWATQQLIEVDRLSDLGQYQEAFKLATEIEPYLRDSVDQSELWSEFSFSADIVSDPPGATVYRQTVDQPDSEWQELGVTPLTGVRFAFDTAFRVRLQLEGHRTVNIREHVFWSKYSGPRHPVINLDRDEDLPEEMVRVRGFAHDLVDYEDFFLDRYEVTNRQYEEFVSSGGYEDPSYWTERFVDNGQLVTWNVAIQSFVDTTGRPGPANWQGGTYPNGQADFPVNGISWYEAAAFANFLGKELPTVEHLRSALPFYRWEGGIMAAQSNLGSQSIRPVGQNRAMSAVGIFDLIGNVREWNSNEAIDGNRVAFGGGWSDPPYFDNHLTVLSPWDRDSANGIRLIRTFDSKEKLARLNTPQLPVEGRDFRVLEPVSDGDFEIFRRLYVYDSFPLNTTTTELREFEHWNRERVEFDLPGGDRGGAILYLPRNSMPPPISMTFDSWSAVDTRLFNHCSWAPTIGMMKNLLSPIQVSGATASSRLPNRHLIETSSLRGCRNTRERSISSKPGKT
jgi:hypothetical protein